MNSEEIRPRITLDVSRLMADAQGKRCGIDPGRIDALGPAAEAAFEAVRKGRGKGGMGWTELPYSQAKTVRDIQEVARDIRARFDSFVVLGIGGSALGPIAVHQALNHPRYNELPREKRPGPRFYVEDNIDPDRMAALFDVVDPRKACFSVVTKSGSTAETMSQYLIVSQWLQKTVGEGWREHIIATTDPEKGNLIRLAGREGFPVFHIPPTVGGRFSELCPVGLLPAAVCGIDIHSLLAGAADMDARCSTGEAWKNPALLEALIQFIAMEEMGLSIQVIMPYADRLKFVADWFSQLWAESLGKNITRKGVAKHVGQTPVKALGVTDQHSQLQLYTEGPHDKIVTFLRAGAFESRVDIPSGGEGFPDLEFLGGKTLNALLDAEFRGTEYALLRSGRLSQTLTLPVINAYTVGQLLYFFELVTAYAGELLDIDAFNQPGVEESKIASYAVLGHPAETYRKKQREILDLPPADSRYVL